MPSLDRKLRKDLERVVRDARRAAQEGARKEIERLCVAAKEPHDALSDDEKRLRVRLRAHARQLGDPRKPDGTHGVAHLTDECAYVHWHRLLFTRFLAETDLLIEPETGVTLTLHDCRELARQRGLDWLDMAASFAARMLPEIFRADDPVLQITLPPETRQALERLLESLPRDVFLADDSLGWVYQFWQADRKEAINASETKIGADELSAVTQLFTEDYMVLFLLHNTLGAWWAGKRLAADPDLARTAPDEATVRAACSVGGYDWTYLRFLREDDGAWRPAAGVFDGWPTAAKDIRVLDPCMGSGHFLVFALPILAAMRAGEEALSSADAVAAVLRDNLHGLEIDLRCTQIAAFALAFAAWRMAG